MPLKIVFYYASPKKEDITFKKEERCNNKNLETKLFTNVYAPKALNKLNKKVGVIKFETQQKKNETKVGHHLGRPSWANLANSQLEKFNKTAVAAAKLATRTTTTAAGQQN